VKKPCWCGCGHEFETWVLPGGQEIVSVSEMAKAHLREDAVREIPKHPFLELLRKENRRP
jgi:hypothetical protein